MQSALAPGATVSLSPKGEEALDTICAEERSLVFLDVMTPKHNGFDVSDAAKN